MSPHDSGMQTPRTEFGTGSVQLLKLQCQSQIHVLLNSSEVWTLSSQCPSTHGAQGLWGTSAFLSTVLSVAFAEHHLC